MDSGSVCKLSGSLEVIPELNIVQEEVSIEVKDELDLWRQQGLFPEVQNRGSRFKGG